MVFTADLYYWLHNFGHNLDPTAALSNAFDEFTPTLLGPGRVGQFVGGSTVGVISSLFGIGGGTVMVPMLSSWQARMTEAVGTAAAAGFPIALTAALTNIVVGWHAPNLPEHAIGYVHWVAWLGIVLVSVPFARLGARLAHALPALLLKRLFALILVVVGLRFLLA